MAALAAARDLPTIGLKDALELCLVLRGDGRGFRRAALRWHSRYVAEARDVDLDEAQGVLALLAALRGPRAASAAGRLPSCSTAAGSNGPRSSSSRSRGQASRSTGSSGRRGVGR